MTLLGNSPYLIEDDYYIEQAGGTGYARPIGNGSSRITVVSDPGGSAINVMRAELQKTDTYPTADARCQLAPDYEIKDGGTYWVRIYLYFPSSGGPPVITGSNFLQLFQLYGAPEEAVSPLAFKLHEENSSGKNWISFFRNGTYSTDRPYSEQLSYDTWYEWTIHLKFAYEGWVEMWLRKKSRLDEFVGEIGSGDQITFWGAGTASSHPERADTTKLEYKTRDNGVNDGGANAPILQLYRKAGEWSPFAAHWGELVMATEYADLGDAEPGPEITTCKPYAYTRDGCVTVPA